MKYRTVTDGEWVYPVKRGYRMACCDCGLVHRVDFDHVKYGRGRRIRIRARRDERCTAAMRREMKKANEDMLRKAGLMGRGFKKAGRMKFAAGT